MQYSRHLEKNLPNQLLERDWVPYKIHFVTYSDSRRHGAGWSVRKGQQKCLQLTELFFRKAHRT